ncbi:MAG: tyrosine-protein phosphatase [Isosphaeraceae bacterium]
MKRSRRLRLVLRLAFLGALVPAGFLGFRWWGGNRGVVIPGRVYRSGQLDGDSLAAWVRRDGIRTVINLRGPNPPIAWYRAERAATLGEGATQVDLTLASDHWLSRAQARTLLEALDGAEYPILIHCQWGAERTGLVSSFLQLLEEGKGPEAAASEFAPYYLYAPTKDGRVMSGHLGLYRAWLLEHRLEHTPSRFRTWLLNDYRPPFPSREYWMFDPYPLVVTTRPAGEAPGPGPLPTARAVTRETR